MNVLYDQFVINDPTRSDAACGPSCTCAHCKPRKYLGANSQLSEFIINHQAPVEASVDPSDILPPHIPLVPTTNIDGKARLRKAQKRLADGAPVRDEDEHGDPLIPPSLVPRRIQCESCHGLGKILNQITNEFDPCLACKGKGFTDGTESKEDVDYSASIVPPRLKIKGPTPTVKNSLSLAERNETLVMPSLLSEPVVNEQSEVTANDADMLLPPGPMFLG